MSVIISISPTPDDIWMIRNAVYRWLVSKVEEFHPNQPDVIERLTVCGYFGGISLDSEMKESPEATKKIVHVLLATIDHILERETPLTDDAGSPWPELQPQVYESLDSLRQMLIRFQIP